MKKFISGFIIGAMIFSMLGVWAAVTYEARQVDFKVMVNGKEFTSDPPPLEVEGRTYLPLRAIGDALGVPVNWNEELRQAEVGESSFYKEDDIYYEESSGVVDVGKKYGFEPIKVEREKDDDGTELINYCYDCTDINPYFSEYIDFIEKSGYQIEKGKKTTDFPISEQWYLVSEKNNNKTPFAIGFVDDLENLKNYFVVTFIAK